MGANDVCQALYRQTATACGLTLGLTGAEQKFNHTRRRFRGLRVQPVVLPPISLCANIDETTTSSFITVEGKEVIQDGRLWKTSSRTAAYGRL